MSESPRLVPRKQDEPQHAEPPNSEPPIPTLQDFAASGPGMPGVRWYVDPKTGDMLVGVPFSMNWMKASQYRMPVVQRRRDWHLDQRQAPYQTKGGAVRLKVTQCARCTILIGQGFFQNEAYLEPVLPAHATLRTKPGWQTVCAINALEHGLHQGFCVLSTQDWAEGIKISDITFPALVQQKRILLEEPFMTAWKEFAQTKRHTYRTFALQWLASADRRALWPTFRNEWAMYLALYHQAHANAWWQRFDLHGHGCPEHHSRPEECAVAFHTQLVPLRLNILFELFKSVYQPPIMTARDLQSSKGALHAA